MDINNTLLAYTGELDDDGKRDIEDLLAYIEKAPPKRGG